MSGMPSARRKSLLILVALVAVLCTVAASVSTFTDRVNRTTTISVVSFSDAGYTIERDASFGYHIAGETLNIMLRESNDNKYDISSQISMTVSWSSPDQAAKFANYTAAITLGGDPVSYKANPNGTISFTLPEKLLSASTSDVESTLAFTIPGLLPSTGALSFTFDQVVVSQSPSGFSKTYGHDELNQDPVNNPMDFSVDVVWNISKDADRSNKDVIAYLTGGPSSFGLEIKRNGQDANSNKGVMMDWVSGTNTPWADYNITSLNMGEEVTTIGDFAFNGETGITTVTIPSTVTSIGKRAFDGSGLTGEVTIPANVKVIKDLAFANLPKVNVFTFGHTTATSDELTLPAKSGVGAGAFYVTPYVATTINSSREDIITYEWETDNRRLIPMLAPSDTWFDGYTGSLTKTQFEKFHIKPYYKPTGTVDAQWDASDPSVPKTVTAYVEGTTITLAGNGSHKIFANPDSSYAFSDTGCEKYGIGYKQVTELTGLGLLDTSKATTMKCMFDRLKSVKHLDVSGFDTSNVTDMYSTFYSLESLEELDVSNFATDKVTDMECMFAGCKKVPELDVSNFVTKYVTTMSCMFSNCESITELDLSSFETTNVTDFSYFLSGCISLPEVDLSPLETGNCENMDGMFIDCIFEELDLSTFDVRKVKIMEWMFARCNSLKSVDTTGWVTSSLEDMACMFMDCYALQSMDMGHFNLSHLSTRLYGEMNVKTFLHCTSLESLVLPASLKTIENEFVYDTPNLKEITFLHSASDPISFPTRTGAATGPWNDDGGAFYAGATYSTANPLRTEIITSNNTIRNYNWTGDFRGYTITAASSTGGSLTATPTVSINGKSISITATPTTGYIYSGSTVSYTEAGEAKTIALAKDATTFTMPAADVTITPKWERAIPMLAKNSTWYTSSTPRSTITEIQIVDSYTPTGTETETWDASDPTVPGTVTAYIEGTKLTISGNGYGEIYANPLSEAAFASAFTVGDFFSSVKSLAGTNILNVSKVTTMERMFVNCGSLTGLDVSNWDVQNVTHMGGMFQGCGKLNNLDVSKWVVGNVTTMTSMFRSCSSLTSLDVSGWRPGLVKNMNGMFFSCSALQALDVTEWGCGSVTDMGSMFQACRELTTLSVSNWDVSKVENFGGMFAGCSNLLEVDVGIWETESATKMNAMFRNCNVLATLDISNWNVSSVTTMNSMFSSCQALTSLDVSGWDVHNVTDMTCMFMDCSALQILDVSTWITSSLTTVSNLYTDNPSAFYDEGMFEGCSSLETIDISNWNMGGVTNTAHMFSDCTSLKSLTIPASAKVISPEFAYNCRSLTEITFLHSASDMPQMPTHAGVKTTTFYTDKNPEGFDCFSDGGAFYVPSYLQTDIIYDNGNTTVKAYDWTGDNRTSVIATSEDLTTFDLIFDPETGTIEGYETGN